MDASVRPMELRAERALVCLALARGKLSDSFCPMSASGMVSWHVIKLA